MSDESSPTPTPETDATATPATEASTTEAGAAPEERRGLRTLLLRGNPLRVGRGLGLLLAGGLPAFLLMAKNTQWASGIVLGTLCILLCTWGALDLLGSFDDTDEPARSTPLETLAVPLLRTVLALVSFALAVGLAGFGLGTRALGDRVHWVWGGFITLLFIGCARELFELLVILGPYAEDENGEKRTIGRRHGFWLIVVAAVMYFPSLGVFSLWDPWETHYGEVAREILAKDDWISLWWAQDGWFWSKPILNFWMQALAMGALQTHYSSDRMLIGEGGLAAAHPEWIVRTPNVLFTIIALYILYRAIALVFGRRAGFLGALVLATVPDWYFLAHQTMTDMPFVAALTAAMGLLILGLNTDGEARARVFSVTFGARKFSVSAFTLVFGAVLLCALPQILYLLSRNIELIASGPGQHGFRPHYDEFQSGSAANCGLPGNEACRWVTPAGVTTLPAIGWRRFGGLRALARFTNEPALQALVWSAVVGIMLYINWGERRTKRLYFVGAFLAAALATMAKGPAGFALPVLCALAYLAASARAGRDIVSRVKHIVKELTEMELITGLAVILVVALPWYVAMYVRHGPPFTDRLIFHDMFNRAFGHVHDTNEGDDTSFRFYIWQLGYALFPWTALAPWSLCAWQSLGLRKGDGILTSAEILRRDRQLDLSVLLLMWFVFSFFLFSFMGTKFHHYIFPAVPPVAMLIGVSLDRALASSRTWQRDAVAIGAATVGVLLAIFGTMRLFPGSWLGEGKPDAAPAKGAALLAIGLLIIIGARWGRSAIKARQEDDVDDLTPASDMAFTPVHVAALVGGALLLVLVGRDLAIDAKTSGASQPGAIRLLQLFTYNYTRPWPDSLDYTAILAGISIVGVLVLLLTPLRAIRNHMLHAFMAFCVVTALWGVHGYMVKLSPHWGQRELMEAYYRDRKNADEPLIAYQMNWKGENFYTSNHIPAFVSTGATFTSWLKGQRDKGIHTMYFVTEHGRTAGLKGEVGPKSYKEMTDTKLNNKFILIKTEL